MARLILEEGGDTRRFKLSGGKLTFGSGDAATLTLQSDDVAQLHGQIEMSDEGAVLRVAKGVTPAKVGGRTIQGPHVMKHGLAVVVGGAKLTVEYDEGEGPRAAAPVRTGAAPTGAGRTGAVRTGAGRTGVGGSSDSRRSSRVERRTRARKSGLPGWATVALILGVVGGLVFVIYKQLGDAGFDYQARWSRYQSTRIEDKIKARTILEQLATEEGLTDAQRAQVEQELAATQPEVAKLSDAKRNSDIQTWLEPRIFAYYEKWPVTKERPHARLFMKRANWFIQEYPTHHDLDRVKRFVERVEPIAELDQPKTFADLDREVWGEIAPSPKDFTEAIRVIDSFLRSTTDDGEKAEAERLRAETLTAESEFYEEQKKNAAVVYDRSRYPDKYDPRLAFGDMVVSVASMYSPELRADAAKRMLAIREAGPSYYEGYKVNKPKRWAQLMTEPSLRAYAEKHGLLD